MSLDSNPDRWHCNRPLDPAFLSSPLTKLVEDAERLNINIIIRIRICFCLLARCFSRSSCDEKKINYFFLARGAGTFALLAFFERWHSFTDEEGFTLDATATTWSNLTTSYAVAWAGIYTTNEACPFFNSWNGINITRIFISRGPRAC